MEDLKQTLQFNITLKKLSMTTLTASIYEHSDIKDKMKEIIHSSGQAPFPIKFIKKEIIKLASLKMKQLDLPKGLFSEIQGVSVFFAQKIAHWSEFVITSLNLDTSYLDQIYWTQLGAIDDGKIFDVYWKNHKSFCKITKSANTSLALILACQYANEDVILANQSEMIKQVQKYLKQVNLPNIENKVELVAAAYLCYLFGAGYDLTHRTDVNKQFMQTGNISIKDIIFMCDGNTNTIKFLWSFLDKAEKDWIIIQLAYDNMRKGLFFGSFSLQLDSKSQNDNTETGAFRLTAYADAVLFLIDQMSPEQRIEFLEHTASGLMELFMRIWPYPEICLKMLENEWICEIISKDRPEVILNKILIRMVQDLADVANISGKCQYPTVFYEILKKVLRLVSKEAKELIYFKPLECFKKGLKFPQAIEKFYFIFDLTALSIIINDRDMSDKRNQMIEMGSKKISKLIDKGNIKSVTNFMMKVLITMDEWLEFNKKWNLEREFSAAAQDVPDFEEKVSTWLKD